MESHKCISKLIIVFSFNIFIIDILWNRVVDIKQCNCIIGNAKSDVLAKCSVDINLTGHSKVQIETVTGMQANICQQMQRIFLLPYEPLPSQEV